jgi:hypothetical protein
VVVTVAVEKVVVLAVIMGVHTAAAGAGGATVATAEASVTFNDVGAAATWSTEGNAGSGRESFVAQASPRCEKNTHINTLVGLGGRQRRPRPHLAAAWPSSRRRCALDMPALEVEIGGHRVNVHVKRVHGGQQSSCEERGRHHSAKTLSLTL